MTLFNGTCNNCIYGDRKPLTCNECGGILRGGFCLPCNLKAENSFNCYQNAYSFNDTSYNPNYLPQPQYENYLCNLCGNNSHDGYDCQQQFSFVYEQGPSYNQNYDDNYYPHDLPSFPCCDNCGGSHETFQCQPINQNVDFSGSDQIQTPQYHDVHPPSNEISDEAFHAKEDLVKSIQTFLEEFNCIPFEEKPQILLEAWFKFFAIKCAQLEDSNELFQKLLEDLKELAEYTESLENSSNEIDASKLVKICREKEFFCIHDNVDDLIESALNSKLLSINSNSQRLDKKEQEVKNVVEQTAELGTRVEKSLQNFKVIHKISISLNSTSQISSVHAIAPILSTKEPEHSLSMGYEHLSVTHETISNDVTESNAEHLLPITSECEVASEDESECDMPAKDDCSRVFTTFSNHLFNDNDDFDSSDDESLPDEDVSAEEFKVYSNPLFDEDEINSDKLDPHCFNVESDFVESWLNQIKESDFDFEEEIHLIENLLNDNSSSRPPKELNADEERIKREHADYISRIEITDDVLPPGIENDDSDEEVDAVEELRVDNSISNTEHEYSESEESDFDNPSVPLPPPEPPDEEFDFEIDFGDEISVVRNTIVEFECIDARVKFDVSNDENDDYSYSMFVMVFSLLSAESEDTIFDPGISI
nr:hypothetical protein [Tanacetum cinerariifolium]